MKRLLQMVGLKCRHTNAGWPHRGPDGIDYQTCLACGARLLSRIQFAGSPMDRPGREEVRT